MDSFRSRLKWIIPILTAAALYFWYKRRKINTSEQSDPGDAEEMRENCKSNGFIFFAIFKRYLIGVEIDTEFRDRFKFGDDVEIKQLAVMYCVICQNVSKIHGARKRK